MDYKHDNIVNFFQRYPDGIKNNFGQITHRDSEFRIRFSVFMQGLLDDFDYNNAILCGGSLYAMLDKSLEIEDVALCDSDIDLFILRSSDEAEGMEGDKTLTKLCSVLKHFENYANAHGLKILYVVRGLLIEVMIQGKRRVQVLLSRYDNEKSCISWMSVVHLHMYYNGDLYASEAAIDNILRKETRMVRAPIKDVKIPQLIARGITPVGDILITKMDPGFHAVLKYLDHLKNTLDAGDILSDPSNGMMVYTDIDTVLENVKDIIQAKWHPTRMDYLKKLKIQSDIDIFDLSIRLPAPEILCRCQFYKTTDHARKLKVLKIKSTVAAESPAIFMERNVILKHSVPLTQKGESTEKVISFIPTDNIMYLERYFRRQSVFRFHADISHVVNPNGTMYKEAELPKELPVNISFMILVNENLDSMMFLDIIEISEIEN